MNKLHYLSASRLGLVVLMLAMALVLLTSACGNQAGIDIPQSTNVPTGDGGTPDLEVPPVDQDTLIAEVLRGQKGDTGPQGEQGLQGQQGLRGCAAG